MGRGLNRHPIKIRRVAIRREESFFREKKSLETRSKWFGTCPDRLGCKLHSNLFIVPNSSLYLHFSYSDKNDHACFIRYAIRRAEEKKKEGRKEEGGEKRDPRRRLILFLEGKRKIACVKHPYSHFVSIVFTSRGGWDGKT